MTDHRTATREEWLAERVKLLAAQWPDRAPKGRNETGPWFKWHDEYGKGQVTTVTPSGARGLSSRRKGPSLRSG